MGESYVSVTPKAWCVFLFSQKEINLAIKKEKINLCEVTINSFKVLEHFDEENCSSSSEFTFATYLNLYKIEMKIENSIAAPKLINNSMKLIFS